MCVDRAAAETAVCAKNGEGGETGARRDLVPRQSPKHKKGESRPQRPIRWFVDCYFLHPWYQECVCIGWTAALQRQPHHLEQ
jgi:hypothetical protein